MKKLICAIVILGTIFLQGITALAGDVPEGLFEDKALLFFGEVVSYDQTDKKITVLPTQKIKGDVTINVEQTYENGVLVGITGFSPVEGEIYLMSYYDKNNPLYVFHITGTDTKTLKIEGVAGTDMWERMQEYLNEGTYEQKELERLEGLSQISKLTVSPIPESTPAATWKPTPEPAIVPERSIANYWLYGLMGTIIIVILYMMSKRQR